MLEKIVRTSKRFHALKLLAAAAVFFTCSLAVRGQTPTVVSGTITDPNGIPYSFAKISAQLTGIPPNVNATILVNGRPTAIGGLQNATTDVNGKWSMNLFCNSAGGGCSVISPSGTTWTFSVSETGVPPPQGTGPQSFTQAVTITGASQTVTFSSVPALTNGGGGTPTPGSQVSFGATVSPFAYGGKFDWKAVTDCTFTNASNSGTCPSASFVSTDLGKQAFGTTFLVALTNGCNGSLCGQVLIPLGFLCPGTSGTSFTMGTTFPGCAADNATASCNGAVVNCAIVYGSQDEFNSINQAATAAWGGINCLALELPAGGAGFTGNPFNVTVPAGSPCAGLNIADATQEGALVFGQGPAQTQLIPLPTYNFGNCTFGFSGAACIAGPPNWAAHDFGIWGYGQADSGTTHNVNLIEFYGRTPSCTASAAWNMSFNNWQAASTGTVGFLASTGCAVMNYSNITAEGFGNTTCKVSLAGGGVTANFNGVDCFGSSGAAAASSLEINTSTVTTNVAMFNSTGGWYWGVNPINSASAIKFVQGNFNSFGDHILAATNGINNFAVFFPSSATTMNLNLTGGTDIEGINSSGTGNSFLFLCGGASTCNINAFNASLTASGTKMAMFNNAGTLNFVDSCANKYTQGSIANSAINIFGTCSQLATTSATTNFGVALGAQTVISSMAPTGPLTFNLTIEQITAGVGCGAGSNTVTPTLSYTAPGGGAQTPALTALSISANGAVDTFQNDTVTITAKPGTNITYTTASTLASAGCSTIPQYVVYAKAVQ